jgi:cellulose synthase/poly-beta-1,6-N-acetylglucosamine synthase-like glycosyltransferase
VVLATREDREEIRRRVEDLLGADYDPARLEVVVALDPTVPRSWATLGLSDPRVRVIEGEAPGGKAATLNSGVAASGGDILVFTDSHQRFQADAIRLLVEALRDPRVGVVSGCLDLPQSGGARSLVHHYWLLERRLRAHEARLHSAVGVTGAICAMPRALWAPLPSGLILDDVYTPMRLVLAGYRVGFSDDARACETRHTTSDQEYRRKVRTLTGVVQLCAWLPAVLSPSRNPIWLQFMFHKILRLLTGYWALAIVLWAAALAGRWAIDHPLSGLWIGLVGAALVVVARERLLGMVREGVLLQTAAIVATVSGFRGRWDIWRR